MPREHEHELINNSSGKTIGKAWWNPETEKIECSNDAVLNLVFGNHSLVTSDDEVRISHLAKAFRNGYITARKVT